MRCFECGKKDEYELKETTRHYEGDGYSFNLKVAVPFCKNCGAPLVNEDLETQIAKLANEEIRKQRGIITTKEISDILNLYNVSQKYLSKLLGWGEITLTRYVSGGYTPSLQNSEKLKSLKDPYVLMKIMSEKIEETNGDIENEPAFQKLKQSVNEQIVEVERNKGKIYQVVNWFLSQSEDDNCLTHLALQKLLYFSQGWNYVFNNQPLFQNDCEAWVHGAVYRVIYDEFKKFKYMPLPKMDKEVSLPAEEIAVLDFVKQHYFNVYTAKTLEKICHLEEPFILTRKGFICNENSVETISKAAIKEYYLRISQQYNISKNSMNNVKAYLNDLLYT